METYTSPRGASPPWATEPAVIFADGRSAIEELAYLLMAPDHAFGDGLQSFIATLERDFRIEEKVMETIGFTDLKAHREQHACILAALHGVVAEAMDGNRGPARAVLEALPQGMIYHLIKMDAGLFAAADRAGLKSMLPAKSVPPPEFFQQFKELETHAD